MVKEEKLNEITKIIPNIGDMAFSLDLRSNLLENALYFLENYNERSNTKHLRFFIITISSFYELLFKYRLTLLNEALIWEKPDQFSKEKHLHADFKSISAQKCLDYAKAFNWISKNEEILIRNIITLRNKYLHFSICEQSEDENVWICEIMENDFFENHYILILKLLNENEQDLKTNPICLTNYDKLFKNKT